MAEGSGLRMEQPEGTYLRISECVGKLSARLHLAFEEAERGVDAADYMQAQV